MAIVAAEWSRRSIQISRTFRANCIKRKNWDVRYQSSRANSNMDDLHFDFEGYLPFDPILFETTNDHLSPYLPPAFSASYVHLSESFYNISTQPGTFSITQLVDTPTWFLLSTFAVSSPSQHYVDLL